MMYFYGPLHMAKQKQDDQLEHTYSSYVSPEDLPEAMNDREMWRERVRDIRASGTTWWWWFHRQLWDTRSVCLKMYNACHFQPVIYFVTSFSLEKFHSHMLIQIELFLSLLDRNRASGTEILIEHISCSWISFKFLEFILTIIRNLFNWQFK